MTDKPDSNWWIGVLGPWSLLPGWLGFELIGVPGQYGEFEILTAFSSTVLVFLGAGLSVFVPVAIWLDTRAFERSGASWSPNPLPWTAVGAVLVVLGITTAVYPLLLAVSVGYLVIRSARVGRLERTAVLVDRNL